MPNANDVQLAKWCSVRFTEKEPCRMIIIQRFPDATNIATITNVSSKSADALVDEVRDHCHADARGLGGHQKYQVKAIHGESDRIYATLSYTADGGMPEASPEAPATMLEDATPRGEKSMSMRHTDTVFRNSQGTLTLAIRLLEKQIDSMSQQLERSNAENEQLRKELRDIRDEDFEKARVRRKDAWMETKKDEIVDSLLPLLPMAGMGLVKKVFPQLPSGAIGAQSEMEMQIRAAFSTMSSEQFHQIMGVLNEGQKQALLPIVLKLATEKEERERKLAEKEAEQPPLPNQRP